MSVTGLTNYEQRYVRFPNCIVITSHNYSPSYRQQRMSPQPRNSDGNADMAGYKAEGLFARMREGLHRLKEQAEEEEDRGNKNLMASESSLSANTSTTTTTTEKKRKFPSPNHDDPRLGRLCYYPRRKLTPEEVQEFVEFTNKWIPAKRRCTESEDDEEGKKKEETTLDDTTSTSH